MKSTEFFIEKAKGYIEVINSFSQSLVSEYEGGFGISPELEDQKSKLSDLYLKIRLLYSEFDKGDIFYSEIKSICEYDAFTSLSTSQEKRLEKLKHSLELFINHLIEFRN